jgi:ring-1,2-phenylacetyl-CoA epoxidase subunit PaaD
MVTALATPDAAVTRPSVEAVTGVAGLVADPELPTLTIADLGILRAVRIADDGHIDVDLTPTYSGCPAVEVIEHDVRHALVGAGWADVTVRRVMAPAWTTDWVTAEGRRKLAEIGIAPPGPACQAAAGSDADGTAAARAATGAGDSTPPESQPVAFVRCPQCGSRDTELLSRFSSTACKALRRCRSCLEPFDHFKPL